MDQTTLLRTEAEARAALITVETSDVTLDLTGDDGFASTTRIAFTCHEPGAGTFVDFAGQTLDRLELNGRTIEPRWEQGRITLDGLAEHNEVVVSGRMAYSSDGEGLHRHVDAADGRTYLYAMSFLDAGPRWFACFDQPDLKSRYTFHVTAPEQWIVRGNARATQVAPGRWELAQSKPLSTYFVTLVAGEYAERTDVWAPGDGDDVPLAILSRRSLESELDREAADVFAVTKACLAEYERLFGMRYPFGDYVQAFVPDFNAGAMENPGCVTFRDQFLPRGEVTRQQRASRAGVIAHEMAHQWFGDLVTMRWWDDLWLNESFAEYMGHRVSTDAAGYELWTEFGSRRRAWGTAADMAPSAHSVAGNGADDARGALANFDGISYAKGATVLRQLATRVGEETFLAGLRQHFAEHAYGNATKDDLLAAWRDQGADGLDAWADVWLGTSGVDVLRARSDGEEVTIEREGSRPHVVRVAVCAPGGTSEESTVTVEGASAPVDLPVAAGSLVLPDSDAAAWARIRPAVAGDDAWWRFDWSVLEPATRRIAVAEAVRDAVRSGELAPSDALDSLLRTASREEHPLLLQAQLAQATDLATTWSDPADRAARTAAVESVAREVLQGSEQGSDRQLVAQRALLVVASDADEVRSWLDGDVLPRPLGPDERWVAVQRYVTLDGAASVVDDELARDDSSAAQVAAATCRAAVPTAEAKRAALAVVLQPGQPSAYLAAASARGIFLPEHDELTAPLVPELFDGLPATASFRQGWALASVTRAGFPLAHADRSTLDACRRVLDDSTLDAALRRELTDDADELERRVVAREGIPAR